MNNRTVAITAIVAIIVIALGVWSYTTPGSPLYPGTGGASSSIRSVAASSAPAVTSSSASSEEEESSSSKPMAASSVSSVASVASAASSDSSFAQTSPRETVSQFYLRAATYNGDVIANVAAGSPFLTSAFAQSLTDDAQLFCISRQPLNFSTVLLARTDTNATVQVNERYATGTVSVTVSAVNDDGEWRIDGVTCPTASLSSSSL